MSLNWASKECGARVIDCSSEVDGCEAGNVLDPDLPNIWLTEEGNPATILRGKQDKEEEYLKNLICKGSVPHWICIALNGKDGRQKTTIRAVGWHCWHPYSTNPKNVVVHVSCDGVKFVVWDTFLATSQAQGAQLFPCSPINTAIFPFIAYEITSTFGGMQTYMNFIYLFSDDVSGASLSDRLPPSTSVASNSTNGSSSSLPISVARYPRNDNYNVDSRGMGGDDYQHEMKRLSLDDGSGHNNISEERGDDNSSMVRNDDIKHNSNDDDTRGKSADGGKGRNIDNTDDADIDKEGNKKDSDKNNTSNTSKDKNNSNSDNMKCISPDGSMLTSIYHNSNNNHLNNDGTSNKSNNNRENNKSPIYDNKSSDFSVSSPSIFYEINNNLDLALGFDRADEEEEEQVYDNRSKSDINNASINISDTLINKKLEKEEGREGRFYGIELEGEEDDNSTTGQSVGSPPLRESSLRLSPAASLLAPLPCSSLPLSSLPSPFFPENVAPPLSSLPSTPSPLSSPPPSSLPVSPIPLPDQAHTPSPIADCQYFFDSDDDNIKHQKDFGDDGNNNSTRLDRSDKNNKNATDKDSSINNNNDHYNSNNDKNKGNHYNSNSTNDNKSSNNVATRNVIACGRDRMLSIENRLADLSNLSPRRTGNSASSSSSPTTSSRNINESERSKTKEREMESLIENENKSHNKSKNGTENSFFRESSQGSINDKKHVSNIQDSSMTAIEINNESTLRYLITRSIEYQKQKQKILLNSVSVNSANSACAINADFQMGNFSLERKGKYFAEIPDQNPTSGETNTGIKKKMREEIINNLNEAEKRNQKRRLESLQTKSLEAEIESIKFKKAEEIGINEMIEEIKKKVKEKKDRITVEMERIRVEKDLETEREKEKEMNRKYPRDAGLEDVDVIVRLLHEKVLRRVYKEMQLKAVKYNEKLKIVEDLQHSVMCKAIMEK